MFKVRHEIYYVNRGDNFEKLTPCLLLFIYLFICAALSETRDRSGNEGFDTLESIPDAVPSVLTEPPIEEQLAWHTLWPESHKLYGHGNELFSLCCDHQGKLVASSCKVLIST